MWINQFVISRRQYLDRAVFAQATPKPKLISKDSFKQIEFMWSTLNQDGPYSIE